MRIDELKETMITLIGTGREHLNGDWFGVSEDDLDLIKDQAKEIIIDYFNIWAKREALIDDDDNDDVVVEEIIEEEEQEEDTEVIEETVNTFVGDAVILEEKPDVNGNIMKSVKVVKTSKDTLDISEEELKKDYDYERYHGEGNQLEDNYHTMSELYYHRMLLFVTILKLAKEKGYELYKSKLHHDGTKIDDYFIVGVFTPEGQYAYHYNLKYWNYFNFVDEWDRAPEWDGQQAEDLHRLLSL